MKDNERIVTIVKVERLGTSVYGNPYYRLHLEDGTSVRTQINASINFGIENSENLNRPVIITTTKAGRVYDIKPAGTPILFKVGDKVRADYHGMGDVLEVDHKNAAGGGVMNYRLNTGGETHLWYSNDELTLVENEDLPS
jgi:hypothetical protein